MDKNLKNLENINKELRNSLAKTARLDQEKTDYMAQVVRNLRIPMSTISGMSAIARRNIGDPNKVLNCLDKIDLAGSQLLKIVNEVTDMSELNDRILLINDSLFNLGELLWQAVGNYTAAAQEKNLSIKVVSNNVRHEHLSGDYSRLSQVIGNLLSNAVNYTMPGGTVTITVTEVHAFKDGNCLFEISVEDTGIGMTQDFMEKLYHPFQRADDPRIAKEQGSGLGLPVSMRLVRMMAGDLKASSEPESGSKFTVSLHLKRQEDIGSKNNYRDTKLLLINDNQAESNEIYEQLKAEGIKADLLSYNDDYLNLISGAIDKNAPYLAVILACGTDCNENDLTAYHTAKAIKDKFSNNMTKLPPLIFISNWWANIAEMNLVNSFNDYLTRPFCMNKMLYALDNISYEKEVPADILLPEISFAGRRILLAEDNQLNAEMIKELLEQHGIIVEVADNGIKVIDMLMNNGENYFDCVLMDVKMPVMNGYTATQMLRANQRPDIAEIPVIAMTADAYSIDIRYAKNAGMNAHIPKPFSIDDLLKILGSLLKAN